MGKVFGIGLNKTGTSSLHSALLQLGLRSFHYGSTRSDERVKRAIREGRPLLVHIGEDFDAYLDISEVVRNFAIADRDYPGSKFILTVRDIDEWVDSRRRHVERNQKLRDRGEYDGAFLEVEPDRWIAQREEHHARVRSYFAERSADLLVMDVCGGDGYGLLCPFLGVEAPDAPFPWRNRDGEWLPHAR